MSDFQRQLSQHYESQKLSDERVHEILREGAAAAVRARRRRWWWSLAAVLVLGAGLTLFQRTGSRAPLAGAPVSPEEVGAAVAQYFSQPDYQLSRVSANVVELAEWLQTQGAPAFTIPENLRNRPSFGCQILEVGKQRVYLLCFVLDVTPEDSAGGMPIKKEMTVIAPDGTMMKKNRPLVHLIVAPRAAFRNVPTPGTWVSLTAQEQWNFQVRAEKELVYMAAAETSSERLSELVQGSN
jgi:hypothetical protein